ncbi:MAG: hypothetical protein B5M56_09465 [Desulfococcus sp. 4484_241]|nr:MAG: hypothetical protein B5M56_09465 [Desulfococcus sp. 4484_241]
MKKALWEKVKAGLKTRVPANNYMMWIEPLEFKTLQDEAIVLACPNLFSKRWVESNYADMIESMACDLGGQRLGVKIEVDPNPGNGQENGNDGKSASGRKDNRHKQLALPNTQLPPPTGRVLKRDFTFDNFVVGNNNDFAYSAVLSMGSKERFGEKALFLASKPGMGKSHLAQALGHHVLRSYPGRRIYYITAEDLSNEMVHAYTTKKIGAFKKKYRTGFDMLLLDDIHALAGKERTQSELTSILDYMLDADKKVLFAGCCLPGEMPKINEQLKSRLSCGLITTMEKPDFRTRVRILQKKASLNGYRVPVEIMECLADNLTQDVRQLESGLKNLAAKSSLLGVPIDMDLAESVIKNMAVHQNAINLDTIKKIVCRSYGISTTEINSRSRKQRIAWPRQVAIYLSRRFTDHSLKTIGRSYNRYHATVIHSINTVEKAMRENRTIHKEIDYIIKKIESGKH